VTPCHILNRSFKEVIIEHFFIAISSPTIKKILAIFSFYVNFPLEQRFPLLFMCSSYLTKEEKKVSLLYLSSEPFFYMHTNRSLKVFGEGKSQQKRGRNEARKFDKFSTISTLNSTTYT
jgi:hypothetical protein